MLYRNHIKEQLVQELLERQKQYLNFYFDNINVDEVENFVEACLQTEGLIIFTGVGKSGIIADKIAMTLVSTGTKALYLPPTNFLHGDIGILSEKDLLVLISRSGETQELLNLIPFARKRHTQLVALTSQKESRLAKMCDLSVYLPVEKELCPFDLAPTTSTTAQLLCGDLLTVALMRAKEFDLSTYVMNHPCGSIGKKMTLRVQDIMSKDLPLAKPSDFLIDVLVELSNKKQGALIITDPDQRLLGIFTDGDLRRALQQRGSDALHRPMQELMIKTPLAITADMLAWDALQYMQKDKKKFVMVLPVIDQDKAIGIIHMHTLLQAGIA